MQSIYGLCPIATIYVENKKHRTPAAGVQDKNIQTTAFVRLS
jgi:hypothetical protein